MEEKFFPILTSSSPILRGIEGGLPSLLGYNGTTAKPAAQTVLVTARDDPLLAQWQYGLGRAVAWTSDTTGRWAKSWIGWKGFSQFASQMVGWTFPGEESGGIEAAFVDRGGRTYLRVESVNADGSPRDFYATSVALVGPDLDPAAVNLSQVAPGVYESPVASLQSGAYAVRVTQTKPGAAALGRTLGLVAPTAAEYRLLGANEPLLAAIRAATGGEQVELPAGRLGARPADDEPLHGHVALAAGSRAAAVAAGHRAAARLAGSPGARRRPALGVRQDPRPARRGAHADVREHAGRPRARRIRGRAQRDPARGLGPCRGSRCRHHGIAGCDRAAGSHCPRPRSPPATPPESAAPPPPPPPDAPPPPPSPAAPSASSGASDDTLARLRDAKRRNRS